MPRSPLFLLLLGLIYFASANNTVIHNNTSQCVPCVLYIFNGWVGTRDNNVHSMYATDVSDWTVCINDHENKELFDL